MKRLIAVLVVLVALMASAMAYQITLPKDWDKIPAGTVYWSGGYSASGVVAEVGNPTSLDPTSTLSFNSNQGVSGTLTNTLKTYTTGKAEGVSRQYVYQDGSMWGIQKAPNTVTYDAQNYKPEVLAAAGFTRSQYAAFSGNLGEDPCKPANQGDAFFGVYFPNEPEPTGGVAVTADGLILKSGIDTAGADVPTSWAGVRVGTHSIATGSTSRLYEAFAGTASSGSAMKVKVEDADGAVITQNRVSGYGEFFGGFTDAWVPVGYNNRIEIEFSSEKSYWPAWTSGSIKNEYEFWLV